MTDVTTATARLKPVTIDLTAPSPPLAPSLPFSETLNIADDTTAVLPEPVIIDLTALPPPSADFARYSEHRRHISRSQTHIEEALKRKILPIEKRERCCECGRLFKATNQSERDCGCLAENGRQSNSQTSTEPLPIKLEILFQEMARNALMAARNEFVIKWQEFKRCASHEATDEAAQEAYRQAWDAVILAKEAYTAAQKDLDMVSNRASREHISRQPRRSPH